MKRAALCLALISAAPALAQPQGEPPCPQTIRAAGVYLVTSGGEGEALLEMPEPRAGTLTLGSLSYTIVGDPKKGTLVGTAETGNVVGQLQLEEAATSLIELRIVGRNLVNKDGTFLKVVSSLTGTKDGQPIVLTRRTPEPIPASELAEFDAGPSPEWQAFFDTVPNYPTVLQAAGVDKFKSMFWYHFGPLFYRGRLDGSARVMVIASDPGPQECLPFVRRPMVGDAGQRVQGFLSKLGIDRSYVLVNAYAYAMRPSYVQKGFGLAIITEDFSNVTPPLTLTSAQRSELKKITRWRNEFFTRVARASKLQAIVPMGGNASPAYRSWMASLPANDPIRQIPVIRVPHPSAVDRDQGAARPDFALEAWQGAVTRLRGIVTPDEGRSNTVPNYGQYLSENDFVRIPRRDLPKAAPLTMGNNVGTRQVTGENNDARRPVPDDKVTLDYVVPESGKVIKYRYRDGRFRPELTTDAFGNKVAVDADGVPIE